MTSKSNSSIHFQNPKTMQIETSTIAYREQKENGDIERMEDWAFLAFKMMGIGTRDSITIYLNETFPNKHFTTEMIGKRFTDLQKKDKIILTEEQARTRKTHYTSGKLQQVWALPDVDVKALMDCLNNKNK